MPLILGKMLGSINPEVLQALPTATTAKRLAATEAGY
jgi:hypothetical protein